MSDYFHIKYQYSSIYQVIDPSLSTGKVIICIKIIIKKKTTVQKCESPEFVILLLKDITKNSDNDI